MSPNIELRFNDFTIWNSVHWTSGLPVRDITQINNLTQAANIGDTTGIKSPGDSLISSFFDPRLCDEQIARLPHIKETDVRPLLNVSSEIPN